MTAEKKNALNKFMAWAGSLGAILMAAFWIGGFYSTTTASNKTLPQHIEEDKMINNETKAFQNATLIKIENLTVSLNFLAKEIERKNDLEAKYHERQNGHR